MNRTNFETAGPTVSLLIGATVVVTRPAASAAAFKKRIAGLGGVALGLPGMGLRESDDPAATRSGLRAARDAAIVIFLSPMAVRYAFALLPTLRFARTTRILAIGAGTARALQRRRLRNVVWPRRQQDSEGVLGLDELAQVRGQRVVFIGAPGGRDLLSTTLRKRGAILQSVHVYRRAPPRLTRRHFAALEQAAGPLLTLLSSAEALDHLRAGLPAALFAKLAASEGIVSSLRLAQRARAAGFQRVHIAASANANDMLVAAIAALARHRL